MSLKQEGRKILYPWGQKVNGDAIFYVKLTKPSHFANAEYPTAFKLVGKTSFPVKPLQYANAFSSIVSKFLGKFIFFKAVHSWKA